MVKTPKKFEFVNFEFPYHSYGVKSYKTKYVLFNKIKYFNLNHIILTKTAFKSHKVIKY